FITRLSNYLRARFAFLSISTWEESRVISDIRRICEDEHIIKTKRNLYTWSVTDGLVSETGKSNTRLKQPIQVLDEIAKIDEPSVFVLKDLHVFLGGAGRQTDYQVVRRIRDLVQSNETAPNPKTVILSSPSITFPSQLDKAVMCFDYHLPSSDEITEVLYEMSEMKKNNPRIGIDLSEEEEEQVIRSAWGLTLQA